MFVFNFLFFQDEFVDMPQSPINEQSTPNIEYGQDTVKDEVDSESEAADTIEEKEKLNTNLEIPQQSVLCMKYEKEDEPMPLVNSSTSPVKIETETKIDDETFKNSTSPCKVEEALVKTEICKTEITSVDKIEPTEVKEERKEVIPVKREPVVFKKEEVSIVEEKGTVEIVDQHEPDTEMEDLSSPIAAMESEAVLKQRAAEMRLEFSGSIPEIVSIASDNEKSENDRKFDQNKSDDNMSIDEFDVEAQMMKITGDDGNDYKEKVDTSSEKDKSMDGIEGLMDSSKEDSESEDKDIEDLKEERNSFMEFHINSERRAFREFETKPEDRGFIDFEIKEIPSRREPENQKLQPTCSEMITSSEESILESTSSNIDLESVPEPPKIEFSSIPPLSERIRKKTDQSQAPKMQLDFEASIIESTIEIEAGDAATKEEQKSMLSSALRELLEAKIDVDETDNVKMDTDNEDGRLANVTHEEDQLDRIQCTNPVNTEVLTMIKTEEQTKVEEVKIEEAVSKEPKRLKDPRTITPTDIPAQTALKPDVPAPVKRKVRTVGMCRKPV